MKKKLLLFMLIVGVTLAFCACGKKSPSNDASPSNPMHIKFSWVTPVEGTAHRLVYDKLAEKVEEYSNGQIIVDAYGAGVLGSEKDVCEAMQMGNVDMVLTGVSVLSYWTQDFAVFDLPGMLESYDHAYKVYDSEYITSKYAAMENLGWHVFGMTDVGFREFVSNIPMDTPNDILGKNIRVPETPILIEFYKDMGASPVTIAYTEVYNALENGTFDAVDMPIPTHYSNKFYEAGKYFYRLYLTPTTDLLMYSQTLWKKLTPDQQDAISKAAADAIEYVRAELPNLEKECLDAMEKEGIQIVNVDMAPWYEKIRTEVWPKMAADGIINMDEVNEIVSMAD